MDPNIEAVLKQNLGSERCAIQRYEDIANFTNGKDYTTFNIVTHILAEELDHEEDIESWLEDIRIFREEICKA